MSILVLPLERHIRIYKDIMLISTLTKVSLSEGFGDLCPLEIKSNPYLFLFKHLLVAACDRATVFIGRTRKDAPLS